MKPSPTAGGRPDPHNPTGDDFAGRLVLGLLVALSAFGVVAWLGAQLAGLMFGGGFLRCGPTTGAKALLALRRHGTDPAAAWPEACGHVLPGPVGYWTSTLAVLACLLWAGLNGWRWWTERARRGLSPLSARAGDGFARRSDLASLVVRAPQAGRVTLGVAGRRVIAAEAQASLAVVGPTGCGKTVGFAIPALLEWDGPIIATSVKTDLLDAALEHRRTKGTVWVYDPTGCTTTPTAGWSPLPLCVTWTGAQQVAAWLAQAAQGRRDTLNDGNYWYGQARKALAPYLYAAATTNRTMADVLRWVDQQDRAEVEPILLAAGGVEAALLHIYATDNKAKKQWAGTEAGMLTAHIHAAAADNDDEPWAAQPFATWPLEQQNVVREAVRADVRRYLDVLYEPEALRTVAASGSADPLISARSLWAKEDRIQSSIYATAEHVLSGWADPGVSAAAARNDIDLDEWLNGNNTIFVVAPTHEQARLQPVLTVLVQQALRTAYETANTNHGTLARPCLVLLDEAGNIAPLRELPAYASTARSHGITFVSIWQDLAQITAIYGQQARTVLNNHRAKLFGSGIADRDTLDYLTRLLGEQRIKDVNHSGDVHGRRRNTISEYTTYRPLAPADALRQIQPGHALLLYGSEPPAHLRLRPWWET